jgi:hypothetical protein
MGRCEHRYLADVYAKGDVETKDGQNTIKPGAKPTHQECQDCGAKVGGGA